MKERIKNLIEKLNNTQALSISEYEELLKNRDGEAYAALAAVSYTHLRAHET